MKMICVFSQVKPNFLKTCR